MRGYERWLGSAMVVTSFSHFFTTLFLYCINNPQLYKTLYKAGVRGGFSGSTDKFTLEEDVFYTSNLSNLYSEYAYFPDSQKIHYRSFVREMFNHGYRGYMDNAFPFDELNPINCSGRGPDPEKANININDILGNYSLTLIDALDSLRVVNNKDHFREAVQLVSEKVSFDSDVNVQVFEVNIRVLGALLSAHVIASDKSSPLYTNIPGYNNELLDLAKDLGSRLLPAFASSTNSLPHPRVNLRHGVLFDEELKQDVNCLAGAGTFVLEFGLLSHLSGDPVYDSVARNAIRALWKMRNQDTGLFGNSFYLNSMQWETNLSGLGAGMDSFYEYLLKAYIMFGDAEYLTLFNEAYEGIQVFNKEGRQNCLTRLGNELPPIFRNVDLKSGSLHTNWIDSLQAALPGIMVLHGDIEEAICQHALHFAIWRRFSALPERFNIAHQKADIDFYPLRPELAESTYLLYRATKSPFYLHVGKTMAEDLNKYTRTKCGFASMKSVKTKSLEDRMESFVLSETLKYLYLLFDEDNPLHSDAAAGKFVFSTEGHILPLIKSSDKPVWGPWFTPSELPVDKRYATQSPQCDSVPFHFQHWLPLPPHLLHQIESVVGLR